MGADKSNKHQTLRIANRNYQPEVVAFDVEHHPVICQETGIAVNGLDVGWCSPIGVADFGVPPSKWVAFPKLSQGSD